MKSDRKLIGAGLLTAMTASLCCITPVLSIIAGGSGLASTFSWLEPFRPYFICLTVLVLGFAWKQKLKTQKQIDCNCKANEKQYFIEGKISLGIITVFAGLMLAFPMYNHVFYPRTEKQLVMVAQSNIRTVEFFISGMTCIACEEHVNYEVNKLSGIIQSDASYEYGKALIKFDNSKTSISEIEKTIKATGYTITSKEK